MTELKDYRSFVPTVAAAAQGNTRVKVMFADGSRGMLDLSDLIGRGPWKKLANPAFFRLAHAAYDTVVWTDEVDLAPEYVWEHADKSRQPLPQETGEQ